MVDVVIDKQQKIVMVSTTRAFLADELDLDIGTLQAEMLIDRLAEVLGPVFSNQGLRDAHDAVRRRMEDAAADIDVLEKYVLRR